jgi:Outer membrane protein beta-barrel domain
MLTVRKTLLTAGLFVAAYALVPGGSQVARAQLGVAAGLNFDSISDVKIGSSKATFDNASGYHVGVFYDLGFGPAAFRFGLFYRDAGTLVASVPGLSGDFDLSLIEIPVDLRLNLTATPIVRPYFSVGPVFSFPSSGNNNFDRNLENMSVSMNVGLGLSMHLMGIEIFPEARYNVGISSFMKDKLSIGGITVQADETQRLNTVMLRLGVRI